MERITQVDLKETSQKIEHLAQFRLKRRALCGCEFIHPLLDRIYVWFFISKILSVVNRDGTVIHTINLRPGEGKNVRVIRICVDQIDGTLWSLSDTGNITHVKQDGALIHSFKLPGAASICVTYNNSVVIGVNSEKYRSSLKVGK